MSKRGELTQEVKVYTQKVLGYEIDVKELRLMPYILYVMTNEQRIDPNKISTEERIILTKWRTAGHIEGGAGGLGITKEFWNIICEIVFMTYVDID